MKQAIIKDTFQPALTSIREAQAILDHLIALLRSRPEESTEKYIESLGEAKKSTGQLVEFLKNQSKLSP
jgi:hypothetical protein